MRVVLVDDEPLARQAMRTLLAAHPELSVVGEAGSVSQARGLIRETKPNLIFLDIQMPGADGFALLQELEVEPRVIFVTAHHQHAVQAFEVNAVDYLLKPVRPERLARSIARLRADQSLPSTSDPAYDLGDRICLRTPERTIVTPVDRIITIEAEGDFVRVWVTGERPLLIGQTLAHYTRVLPSPPFTTISRSLLIHGTRIQKTEQLNRNRTHLWMEGLESPFAVGRSAAARLKAVIEQGKSNPQVQLRKNS